MGKRANVNKNTLAFRENNGQALAAADRNGRHVDVEEEGLVPWPMAMSAGLPQVARSEELAQTESLERKEGQTYFVQKMA